MGEILNIPSDISADGREVWDWASKFSEHVHRQDEIRRLSSDLARRGNRCGDCAKWMKSRACPKEQNIGGMSRGPSSDSPKCGQFLESGTATKRREEITAKLAALKQEPTS
jgi:hypothetical protein